MKEITILLPTANRCEFLRSALESIALQSELSAVQEVLVSENGGCRNSRKVCEEFADRLPIRWVFQERSRTPQEHGIWLSNQAHTTYVALLADDDMWDKYHLQEAMAGLRSHPECVAYFGQAICVENEACQPLYRFAWTFASLRAPAFVLRDVTPWLPEDVAVNSLACTPLNIWAAVVQTSVHRQALAESTGHPYFGKFPSNDSFYLWRLACHGPLAVGRHVGLFYRKHPDSDIETSMRLHRELVVQQDLEIRQEIVRQAAEHGIDALALWRSHYRHLSTLGLQNTVFIPSAPLRTWLLSDMADVESIMPPVRPLQQAFSLTRRVVVNLTPPIVGKLLRRLVPRR